MMLLKYYPSQEPKNAIWNCDRDVDQTEEAENVGPAADSDEPSYSPEEPVSLLRFP